MRPSIAVLTALAVAPSIAFATIDSRDSIAPAALDTTLIRVFGQYQAVFRADVPVSKNEPDPILELDDATIVAIFDAANTADIETGNLAAERGQSQEVRAFGAMLARDHTQVRQLGRDLATKLGVTPTPPKDNSAADHAATMARLRAPSGAEFDHAFLQYEVTFHKTVIDAIKSTLLPAIDNAELKALVVKVAPAFEAHMIAADHLDKKLASRGGK